MAFRLLYRISFDLMLFLATLTLTVDVVQDNPIAPLFPLAVAVAAVLAGLTVDRTGRGLSRSWANVLAVGSIALSYLEYRADTTQLVSALGHWLVYLQLIKMFLPKTAEDEWFLFLLALTQAVVGAFQPGEWVGAVLTIWALTALWTLGLFHLRREADRAAREADQGRGAMPGGVEASIGDSYPGLVDLSFVASTVNMAVLTLILGGMIFLLMPRWENERARRLRGQVVTQHLTGFSDSVRLGQMGQILENESIVMTAELFDENDRRLDPEEELYWRGVTLQRYESGRWYRSNARPDEFDEGAPAMSPGEQRIRQVVKLEQNDTDVLFSLRPVIWAEGPDLLLNREDGTLFRQDLRPPVPYLPRLNRYPGRYTYIVHSRRDASAPQPREIMPNLDQDELLNVPTELRARFTPLVESVLRGIPKDPALQASALESYLRDGEFRYSLRMTIVDPGVDPIEDFLFNRKEGHCEYFASALTLLLRTAGIPARLVNGFKGGDWNDLGQVLSVRQKHAHSWVEALVGQSGTGRRARPDWKRLDPTPAEQRDESLARVGGLGARFRFATDYIRYVWVFYVVGFDSDRQQRLVYGPIKAVFTEARRGFGLMWDAFRRGMAALLHFPTIHSVFSVRGFLAAVIILCFSVGIFALVAGLARFFRRRWGRSSDVAAELASGVALYQRLHLILNQIGQSRATAETPREFAQRVGDVLGTRGPELARIPSRVVEAYYGVRFGDQRLSLSSLHELEASLDALEAALNPS